MTRKKRSENVLEDTNKIMAKESKSPSDIGDVPITLKNSIEDQSFGQKSDLNDTINYQTVNESKIFDIQNKISSQK